MDPHICTDCQIDHGADFSLYQYIDTAKLQCLNEKEIRSCVSQFRSWESRLQNTNVLESDADEQLLIFIPFTGQVKLKSIAIRTHPDSQAPKTIKVFANADPSMNFDQAEQTKPTQQLELLQPQDIPLEPVQYPLKTSLFPCVWSITLFIQSNYGSDSTKMLYIGLGGEFSKMSKEPVIAIYEKAANPKDHTPIIKVLSN